jgi:hypothetical protein
VGCDEEIKVEFFYTFLRNRLLPGASDFPFLMAKSFGKLIGLDTMRVRFHHHYSEFLSVPASNPTLSAIIFICLRAQAARNTLSTAC